MSASGSTRVLTPKMGLFLALGVASGLPSPLMGDAARAWLTDVQVDPKTVTALALLTLPLALKFLWAPLLERQLPWLGRRRGWLVVTQSAVALAILVMATCDPSGSLRLFAAALLGLAVCSASQDVVVDGYRTERLDRGEVGFGSTMATTGWRLGNLLAGSLIFFLAERIGWRWSYVSMGVVHLATMIPSWLAKEPATRVRSLGPKEALVEPFRAFAARHGWRATVLLLIFAAVFKASDGMANTIAVSFLKQVGFTNHDLAIRGGLGLLMAILGGVLGGFALPRLGLVRGLVIFGLLQMASNLVYLVIGAAGPTLTALVALVVVENLCMGVAVAAFMGFLVVCCDRAWAATQYALLTSAMFLGAVLLGSWSGAVQEKLGYTTFFLLTVAVGLPGMLLIIPVVRMADLSRPDEPQLPG